MASTARCAGSPGSPRELTLVATSTATEPRHAPTASPVLGLVRIELGEWLAGARLGLGPPMMGAQTAQDAPVSVHQ